MTVTFNIWGHNVTVTDEAQVVCSNKDIQTDLQIQLDMYVDEYGVTAWPQEILAVALKEQGHIDEYEAIDLDGDKQIIY